MTGRSARRLAARAAAALAAATGLLAGRERRRHGRGEYRLFLLEYHDVSAGGREAEGVIAQTRFRRHLHHLRRRYRCVTLAEGARRLAAPGGLAEDLAAVTFDDGYAGNFEAAWPALREAGVPATFFLTTGFLDGHGLWFDRARRLLAAQRLLATRRQGGRPLSPALARRLAAALDGHPLTGDPEAVLDRFKRLPPRRRDDLLDELAATAGEPASPAATPLTWDQAQQLLAAGAELGAHTVNHPVLATLSPAEQEEEIRASRRRIAEETGTPPTTFAYPNGAAGDFDRHTLALLPRAGFSAACTTLCGSNPPGADPYTLRRHGVGADPLLLLRARLAGLFDRG